MLALRELQTEFRLALLARGETSASLRDALADDPFADERIAIYRNNVLASLTAVLRDTFPVVSKLVDERFFAYAAHEFVCSNPPSRPALSEYGGAFADFLVHFPPCRDLVYLADVARLEWRLNEAAVAPDEPSLSSDVLLSIASEDAAELRFRLAAGYLESRWPVDRIWWANQPDALEETIDLNSRGALIEVSRREGVAQIRSLASAEFTFRRALSEGATLGEAIGQAINENDFSPAEAFSAIFRDGLVVGVIAKKDSQP
jgi:hypothetical protein